MTRLFVFDLDGTLVDSRTDLAGATNALVVSLGGKPLPEERIVGMIGEGAALLVRRALEAASLDPESPGALERFLELYDARLLDATLPYDGMVAALDRIAAKGASMAVLTNKPSAAANRLLRGLHLRDYFSDVVGGDSPFGRKPDPAGLLHLVSTAGVAAASALMIGDSAIDLETARRAGVPICLARYGFGYHFDPVDLRGDEIVIDHPRELAE